MKKLTKPIQVYASKKGDIEKLIKGLTKNSPEFRKMFNIKK